MLAARLCSMGVSGRAALSLRGFAKPIQISTPLVRLMAQDTRSGFARHAARRKTLKETATTPTSGAPFQVGQGLVAGAAVVGMGALAYYGLGLSNEAGAVDRQVDLVKPGVLLGMGNPLLDISATVKPELLAKHNLKANDAILTEDEAIFEDMKSYELDFIAGGATQNSIRVAQWMLGKKYATAYFGCVGRDDTSKTLEEKAREAGVNVQYQFSEYPTGRCAVLITGQDRSLVTKLDAANHYNVSHLEEEANWNAVKAANVVYSAGFFLTVSVDSMLKVSKHCAANNKTYCLNLSAPFLIQFVKYQMKSVLPFADIVFGNETEIVDTNGAGDAFVGGFLAQYVQDKPLETAVRCGIWAATHIIQRSGCTYAETCDFS